MIRAVWRPAARLAVFWSLAIALQWFQGSYRSDRAGHPDDPAHIVTGLMAREYLVSGTSRPPMEFARDYYLHYPKVALGHWPPVFYAEQAAWALFFPASRGSLLVMLALQLAVLCSLLWSALRERFGPFAAWCGAILLPTIPSVRAATVDVMTEVPVAVLILLAALAWARFLNTGGGRSAVAFGFFSAAAILTKATAIVLAPVPLLSVVLLGRTELLRRALFWLPAVIVAILCVPWHLFAPSSMHQRAALYGAPGLLTRRIKLPWISWSGPLGLSIAGLAALGIGVLLWQRFRGRRPDALLATAAAAVAGATLGRWLFRVWDERHFAEAAPLFVLLAVCGAAWVVTWRFWRQWSARAGRTVVILAAALIIASNLRSTRSREPVGYRRLAEAIVSGAAGPAATILVSGDPGAEGGVIAEIAQREPLPRRFIVRATKLFVDATWLGKLQRAPVGDSAEIYALLTAVPVDLIVIDTVYPASYPYQSQLGQLLADHSESWRPLDLPGIGPELRVIRRVDSAPLADPERASRLRAALPDPAL